MSAPAPDALFARVYDELRRLARAQLAGERSTHTLQATALVHEAYLRLRGELGLAQAEPGRFYGAAAEAMRRILIDHARRQGAQKRGGRPVREPLPLDAAAEELAPQFVLELDEALECLSQDDPRAAEIVRLRFYVGLTEAEVAEALRRSERSVRREWAYARAWLYRRMGG